MQVTVEAPNLFLPLLGVNCNGKFIFGTCHTCIKTEQRSLCRHSSRERQLTDTWTTSEIEAAVRWGYSIVKIHEMHLFSEVSVHEIGFMIKYCNNLSISLPSSQLTG